MCMYDTLVQVNPFSLHLIGHLVDQSIDQLDSHKYLTLEQRVKPNLGRAGVSVVLLQFAKHRAGATSQVQN